MILYYIDKTNHHYIKFLEELFMKLSQPTKKVFNASLILAVVSVLVLVLSVFVWTDVLPLVSYVFLLVSFILLALGNMLKGF